MFGEQLRVKPVAGCRRRAGASFFSRLFAGLGNTLWGAEERNSKIKAPIDRTHFS